MNLVNEKRIPLKTGDPSNAEQKEVHARACPRGNTQSKQQRINTREITGKASQDDNDNTQQKSASNPLHQGICHHSEDKPSSILAKLIYELV
jgi:hypothetical protein